MNANSKRLLNEMRRNTQESEISEYLCAVFYLRCAKCNAHDKLMTEDAEEAACGYYEKGWRVKKEKPLCPKCV